MKIPEMTEGEPPQFKVTVKARMYHGVLYKAMMRLSMNQTELAEYLGIGLDLLGKMMRLKRVPRFDTKPGKALKHKLEELTEMTVSELFPSHVFTDEFLGQDKTIQVTKEVPTYLLSNVGMVHQLALPPDEELMLAEESDRSIGDVLGETLAVLSERERAVIQKRFFERKTLKQIGLEFNVGRNRIFQIERKALRTLRHPKVMRILRRFNPKAGEIDPFFGWFDKVIPLPDLQKKW